MNLQSRDLFDDSTMSFGEHLEALRIHLWKAIVGMAICVVIALFFGQEIIAVMRQPVDRALAKYSHDITVKDDLSSDVDLWEWLKGQFGLGTLSEVVADEDVEVEAEKEAEKEEAPRDTLVVTVDGFDLGQQLHQRAPEAYPEPPESLKEKPLTLTLHSPLFATWQGAAEQLNKPVTLNVQEAFMTYLKVSMIAGFVLSAPWVFYQIWMFVAAGLYKHERKFVYLYGCLSLLLFAIGVVFCFKLVFPFVLDFLLGFNVWMELTPQIRLSEWVNFAVLLPLMFGISFQLPLVMRFLQAISIFTVEGYQEKRRMAILVISALSMFLTPADPMSMILMMVPLIILYELGIVLCRMAPSTNPFEDAATI